LNTNRRRNEEIYGNVYRKKEYQLEKYGHISHNKTRRGSLEKTYVGLSPLNSERQYYLNQRRGPKVIEKLYQGEEYYLSQANTHRKDYEHLFLNLSEDY
jgi:hypothetical protein